MSTLIVKKEVHRLPDVLEPDVIYFVRTGAGFDIYVTDHTGSVAYKANSSASNASIESKIESIIAINQSQEARLDDLAKKLKQ